MILTEQNYPQFGPRGNFSPNRLRISPQNHGFSNKPLADTVVEFVESASRCFALILGEVSPRPPRSLRSLSAPRERSAVVELVEMTWQILGSGAYVISTSSMTALKVLSVGMQGFTDKLMKNKVLSGERVGFTDK